VNTSGKSSASRHRGATSTQKTVQAVTDWPCVIAWHIMSPCSATRTGSTHAAHDAPSQHSPVGIAVPWEVYRNCVLACRADRHEEAGQEATQHTIGLPAHDGSCGATLGAVSDEVGVEVDHPAESGSLATPRRLKEHKSGRSRCSSIMSLGTSCRPTLIQAPKSSARAV